MGKLFIASIKRMWSSEGNANLSINDTLLCMINEFNVMREGNLHLADYSYQKMNGIVKRFL